jgi:dTDP-4-amino-4,6-dideoxygalactose transaminase
MLNTPFSAWPSFSEEEAAAVSEVLRSNRVNYWTGQQCRDFEREFAAWADSAHAIALTNGTVALDLPLKCLNIGPGDEVIVTPRSFIASVSSVINVGATPVFADVDRDSGNITAESIAAVMTPKTKAVVPVHLAGWPCDMPDILAATAANGVHVIEDCAQAHGATIDGKAVGSFGNVGAWSFCQDKIMTTGGEGGMVTCDDADLADAMWSYKDHGKSHSAVYQRKHPPGFRWVHEGFGTNWRMIEMQAVIGRIQLGRMTEWTAKRTSNANAIAAMLAQHADLVRCPLPDQRRYTHAFYRLYAYLDPAALKPDWDRDRIIGTVVERGVPFLHGTCSEIYLEKAFDDSGFRPKDRLPVARELGETSLMFLVHPTLTAGEIETCCSVVDKVLSEASR